MAEPSGRLESDRLDSIRLIHESEELELQIKDILEKYKCSNKDYEKVSTMLTHVYLCGFEVGKRCVVK